jgi:hypothetical protein
VALRVGSFFVSFIDGLIQESLSVLVSLANVSHFLLSQLAFVNHDVRNFLSPAIILSA